MIRKCERRLKRPSLTLRRTHFFRGPNDSPFHSIRQSGRRLESDSTPARLRFGTQNASDSRLVNGSSFARSASDALRSPAFPRDPEPRGCGSAPVGPISSGCSSGSRKDKSIGAEERRPPSRAIARLLEAAYQFCGGSFLLVLEPRYGNRPRLPRLQFPTLRAGLYGRAIGAVPEVPVGDSGAGRLAV